MQETQIVIDLILILSFLTLYGTVTWSLIRYSTRESYRYWAVGWVIYSLGSLCALLSPSDGLILFDAFTLAGMYVGSTLILDGSRSRRLTRKRISIYLIGIVLAGIYLLLELKVPIIRDQLWMALIFGLITVLLPWLWLYPSIGIGFLASKTPKKSPYIVTSLINHTDFGLGLVVWIVVFRRFFM